MGNIKIYKDGNDLYIRISNCSDSVEDFIKKAVGTSVLEIAKDVTTTTTVADKPVNEVEARYGKTVYLYCLQKV